MWKFLFWNSAQRRRVNQRFCKENVTKVHFCSWVFSNKCLRREFMSSGEVCKLIRQAPVRTGWMMHQAAEWTQCQQQNVNSKCFSHPVSPLENLNHWHFISQRSKHISCCLARNTQTVQMQTHPTEKAALFVRSNTHHANMHNLFERNPRTEGHQRTCCVQPLSSLTLLWLIILFERCCNSR